MTKRQRHGLGYMLLASTVMMVSAAAGGAAGMAMLWSFGWLAGYFMLMAEDKPAKAAAEAAWAEYWETARPDCGRKNYDYMLKHALAAVSYTVDLADAMSAVKPEL